MNLSLIALRLPHMAWGYTCSCGTIVTRAEGQFVLIYRDTPTLVCEICHDEATFVMEKFVKK